MVPRPSKQSKGWCTVRDPGVDINEEPTGDEGWGFCSTQEVTMYHHHGDSLTENSSRVVGGGRTGKTQIDFDL